MHFKQRKSNLHWLQTEGGRRLQNNISESVKKIKEMKKKTMIFFFFSKDLIIISCLLYLITSKDRLFCVLQDSDIIITFGSLGFFFFLFLFIHVN